MIRESVFKYGPNMELEVEHNSVLKRCMIVQGKREGLCRMSCVGRRIWNPEDSTSRLCSIIFSRITPSDDFMDISGTTHLNLASDSL